MNTKRIWALCLTGLAAGFLSGCNHDSFQRNEGVTSYAGNAIAANTAMQMVDPWMEGVGDTNLKTPAERPVAETPAADTQTVTAPTTTQ